MDNSKDRGSRKNPYTMHFLYAALMKADNLPYLMEVRVSGERLIKRMLKKGPKDTGNPFHHIPSGNISEVKQVTADEVLLKNDRKIPRTAEGLADYEVIFQRKRMIGEYPSFKTDVKEVGKFKECLGGGWHSMIPVYEYEGIFYAPIECSGTMNAYYAEEAGLC